MATKSPAVLRPIPQLAKSCKPQARECSITDTDVTETGSSLTLTWALAEVLKVARDLVYVAITVSAGLATILCRCNDFELALKVSLRLCTGG